MRQRGRKSANLAVLNVDGSASKLEPPPNLSDDERTLFAELIDTTNARHFRPTDLPLQTSFIQATLLARSTARDPGKVATWEKAVRLQATLATRLRLSPQSRTDPKTIGRQQARPFKPPWEI
jgi:hypothetical protein